MLVRTCFGLKKIRPFDVLEMWRGGLSASNEFPVTLKKRDESGLYEAEVWTIAEKDAAGLSVLSEVLVNPEPPEAEPPLTAPVNGAWVVRRIEDVPKNDE